MMTNKILHFLYPFFAFLLPLQTRWIGYDAWVGIGVWEYGRVSVYGFDVILAFIAALIFFTHSRTRLRLNITVRRALCASVLCIFAAYELLVSSHPLLTAAVLARVGLGFVAGLYMANSMGALALRRTLVAFVIAMVISAGFGTVQFFTQDSLVASKWLGLAHQDPSTLGVSVVESEGGRWLRAHGTLPHPNALGGFAALALITFLILAHAYSPARARAGQPLSKLTEFCRKVFIIIAPLILIAGIITSASRAALIAAAAGITLCVIQFRRMDTPRHAPAFISIAVGVCLVSVIFWPFLSPRFTVKSRLERLSIQKRLSAFADAGTLAYSHGIFGTGLGAYTRALQEEFPSRKIWDQQPVHNVPLLLALELGLGGMLIMGLGGLLWIKVQSLKSKVQNKPHIRDWKFEIPLIACWFVLAMLDHYLWTLPSGLYLSLIIGWAILVGIRQRQGLDSVWGSA